MSINNDIVQLAIRGTLKTAVLEEARTIHNQTAGNPAGVAAARALGDLSHNVFVPLGDAHDVASELLILDLWNNVEGLGKFFSDPQVQAGGDMIFAKRDPVVWQAAGARGFVLPTPAGRAQRFVGCFAGPSRRATPPWPRSTPSSANRSTPGDWRVRSRIRYSFV